jgi:glutaredoxin
VVELYVSGSEAAPEVDSIRGALQNREGVRLREFDVGADASAARRWRQIGERLQPSESTLPAVYTAGELVVHTGDESAFRWKLDSLFSLTVFVRTGCPHCADAKRDLQTIKRQYPGLTVVLRDLATDKTAPADLQALVKRYRKSAASVPVFHVFNQLLVGYDHAGVSAQRLDTALRQWTVPCDTSPRDSDPQQREPSAASPRRSLVEPSGASAIGNAGLDDRSGASWFENRPPGPLLGVWFRRSTRGGRS